MFCVSVVLACVCINSLLLVSESARPHIILILADDLGWDDISIHGSQQIPTPFIDSLAINGILLNNYYVQPICTPSRAALMTGRHPMQLGLQHDVIEGSQPYGLGLNETILPQYLKTLGYKTHMVGKWHLGFFAKEYTPMYRGFDSHYGYYQACEDYWDHTVQEYGESSYMTWGLDFWNGTNIDKTGFGQYSTELFTRETVRIIYEHDEDKPLFLYLPYQAVHSGNPGNPVKLQAPWEYVEKFGYIKDKERRYFAAMVSALDHSIGSVLSALKYRGFLENSVIVFSTDNGGPAKPQNYNAACNWPLRGAKRTMWEGGLRGNGILWSPLLNKYKYVSNHMMQITDWLPTLLEAAGYDMSKLPTNLYGISQWQALSNNEPGLRKEMIHNIDPINGDGALRQGHMKIVFGAGDTERYDGWVPPDEIVADTTRDRHNEISLKQTALLNEYYSILNSTSKMLNNAYVGQFTTTKVDCGPGHGNLTDCKPWVSPCLFNITVDPCEYHNLAAKHLEILFPMWKRVKQLAASAAPPRNMLDDPNGWPVYHGGVWRPWITL